MKNIIIAVDFDGTIVENEFPEIGKPKLNAFKVLKALQQKEFKLILWTCRNNKYLYDAVQFCKQNGVTFDAVNENYEDLDFANPKILYDVLIDDRNFDTIINWKDIWNKLKNFSK